METGLKEIGGTKYYLRMSNFNANRLKWIADGHYWLPSSGAIPDWIVSRK